MECEPADMPTYLLNKGSESFLIRNGPSNIELTISKALSYIAARLLREKELGGETVDAQPLEEIERQIA